MNFAPTINAYGMCCSPYLSQHAVDGSRYTMEKTVDEIDASRAVSFFYSGTLIEAQSELQAAAEEARVQNWDGYGALPVKAAALVRAEQLLQLLPRTRNAPEFSIHPDGMVGLDWSWGTGQMVSLAVDGSGLTYYASSIGRDKRHGAAYVSDSLPTVLQEILAPLC